MFIRTMRPVFALLIFSIILPVIFVSGCVRRMPEIVVSSETEAENSAPDEKELAAKEFATRIAASLDDSRLSAQVIITGIDGRGELNWAMAALLKEIPAGGMMLFKYNLDAGNDEIRKLIAETSALISLGTAVALDNETGEKTKAAILPFAAVDHEGGYVNRFRRGVADLPPAAFYWETAQDKGKGRETAVAQIYSDGLNAGRIINGLGVNLNFAPVAESLNDNNRDFLDDRAYGPDPAFTAKAAAAFIMGMAQAGVLCAVKHFPGSAGADPHFFPSVLRGDRAALAELTAPFAALVGDGHARAVMVSHSSVPARDSENVASLSPEIMGGWLRQELGFDGVIICDDFSMAAATGKDRPETAPETAAVRALAAGADMVMVWPLDLRRTHRELQAALGDGRLSRERLRAAAARIIYEKLRLGLIKFDDE